MDRLWAIGTTTSSRPWIRRIGASAEADLRGLDGKLYATATSTCLVMER